MPYLEDPDATALHAWSLVHGLAMLVLDRRIEWDEALVERVVSLAFGGVWIGRPRFRISPAPALPVEPKPQAGRPP